MGIRPLPPCGRGPCVSTQEPDLDPVRHIEPLAFAAAPGVAMVAALAALGRVPRLRILERDGTSVHAVIRSAWLRAPSDVELRVDDTAGLVHLRVATPFALRERSQSRAVALLLLGLLDRELRSR